MSVLAYLNRRPSTSERKGAGITAVTVGRKIFNVGQVSLIAEQSNSVLLSVMWISFCVGERGV